MSAQANSTASHKSFNMSTSHQTGARGTHSATKRASLKEIAAVHLMCTVHCTHEAKRLHTRRRMRSRPSNLARFLPHSGRCASSFALGRVFPSDARHAEHGLSVTLQFGLESRVGMLGDCRTSGDDLLAWPRSEAPVATWSNLGGIFHFSTAYSTLGILLVH